MASPDEPSGKLSADGKSMRTGLDTLEVPVTAPDGSGQVLQFQWMTIHPATAIALSPASDELAPPAVQVSRMMKHYQKAFANKRAEVSQSAKQKNDARPIPRSPFLRADGVHVDLCDLFDPPLLSESLYVGSCDEKDEMRSSAKKACPHELSGGKSQSHSDGSCADGMRLWFLRLLDHALTECTSAAVNRRTPPWAESVDESPLAKMAHDDIESFLPANWICEQIRERDSDSSTGPNFAMLVMILLAEESATEAMGRFVVSVLAPAIFEREGTLSHRDMVVETRYTRRLALALLMKCSLARLDKSSLRNLLSPATGTSRSRGSEVMDELRRCIIDNYYAQTTGWGHI